MKSSQLLFRTFDNGYLPVNEKLKSNMRGYTLQPVFRINYWVKALNSVFLRACHHHATTKTENFRFI